MRLRPWPSTPRSSPWFPSGTTTPTGWAPSSASRWHALSSFNSCSRLSYLPSSFAFLAQNWKGQELLATAWRRVGCICLAFLPAIHRLQTIYRTSSTHVFATAPRLAQLGSTLTVRGSALILIIGVLVAMRTRRFTFASRPDPLEDTPLCLSGAGSIPDPLCLEHSNIDSRVHTSLSARRGPGDRTLVGAGCQPDGFPYATIAMLSGHGCGNGIHLFYLHARKVARNQLESRLGVC
jgi:hypothetical protein